MVVSIGEPAARLVGPVVDLAGGVHGLTATGEEPDPPDQPLGARADRTIVPQHSLPMLEPRRRLVVQPVANPNRRLRLPGHIRRHPAEHRRHVVEVVGRTTPPHRDLQVHRSPIRGQRHSARWASPYE